LRRLRIGTAFASVQDKVTHSDRAPKAMKHPTLLRLSDNPRFVRATVVVAWVLSMVAMLSMVALIMAGMR